MNRNHKGKIAQKMAEKLFTQASRISTLTSIVACAEDETGLENGALSGEISNGDML